MVLLVILLGHVVGAGDSFDALSSGGDHISVAVGVSLLDTAVRVVMGRWLVIRTPHTTSAASTVVLPPSARLLLMLTMLLLLMMPNWLLALLLLVFDSEWALYFGMPKLVAVLTQDTSVVPVHRLNYGAASRVGF